jgi:hypothetical protein
MRLVIATIATAIVFLIALLATGEISPMQQKPCIRGSVENLFTSCKALTRTKASTMDDRAECRAVLPRVRCFLTALKWQGSHPAIMPVRRDATQSLKTSGFARVALISVVFSALTSLAHGRLSRDLPLFAVLGPTVGASRACQRES